MSDSPFLLRSKRILQYLGRAVFALLAGVGAFVLGRSVLHGFLAEGGFSSRHGRFITAASDPIFYWLSLGAGTAITVFLAFACMLFISTLIPPNKAKMAPRDRQRADLEQNNFNTQRMERELEKLINQAKQKNREE